MRENRMFLRKKYIFNILITVIFAALLTGCAETEVPQDDTSAVTEEQKTQEEEMLKTEENIQQTLPEDTAENLSSVFSVSPKEDISWAVCSEGIYCYGTGGYGMCGYIGEDGEEITPCIYEEAMPFSEGLACVRLDGKYGYIGKDGETVLPFIYDQASSFREGTAYFSIGEEYGLIDQEGNVITELTDCDSISSFREGLAYFSVDGRYGYMDRNGRVVIEPVYEDAGYFYKGHAVVVRDGLSGVVDKDGREIIPLEYYRISLEDSCILAQGEDVFYFFDMQGREISSGTCNWVNGWNDVFYIYCDDKTRMADKNGRLIAETIYQYISPLPEQELVIAENEAEKYGVLNYEGEIIVPFIYDYISRGGEDGGLIVTDADTGKNGYLSGDDFSLKVPMIYDRFHDFAAEKMTAVLDEKYGVIRYDGTVEIPIEYEGIWQFSDGSMAVKKDLATELKDSQGNLIYADETGRCCNVSEAGDGYEIYLKDNMDEDDSFLWRMDRVFIDKQGNIVVSDYSDRILVQGTENTYLLNNGVLLITGDENGGVTEAVEDILLTNQITPEKRLFAELLKGGEDVSTGIDPQLISYMEQIRHYRIFYKLYRPGDTEDVLLYFYAEPWRRGNFPESDSAFFAIKNGQIEQLIIANECGGSFRGDQACFWYDKKEKTLKPGTTGFWGVFGGYAGGMEVYKLENGQAVQEAFLMQYDQSTGNYEEEELLENAELFYDTEGKPYTKETILDAGAVTEYLVNEKQVSEEEYRAVEMRYQSYMPF